MCCAEPDPTPDVSVNSKRCGVCHATEPSGEESDCTPTSNSILRKRKAPQAAKKSVRFSPMARVVHVPGRSRLGEAEVSAMWWSEQQLDEIMDDGYRILASVKRIRLFIPWANLPEDWRGIELWGESDDIMERKSEKRHVVRAVLRQQAMQRRAKQFDTEAIAAASRAHSFNARQLAREMGREDAKVAEDFLSVGSAFIADSPPPFLALLAPELYNELSAKNLAKRSCKVILKPLGKTTKSKLVQKKIPILVCAA